MTPTALSAPSSSISPPIPEGIEPPGVLLVLGTDASGKNHVANLIVSMLERSGRRVEKREGGFSKRRTDATSSEDKGPIRLLLEQSFLTTFPVNRGWLPLLLTALIARDLKRFRPVEGTTVLVISHTALRILAFILGHRFRRTGEIRIPRHLDLVLRHMVPVTGAKTIVLDIADEIRRKRIDLRRRSGTMDNFDRYMALDPVRSERIEHFLVWLAKRYLNAVVIENDDLDDAALTTEVLRAFSIFARRGDAR